MPTNNHSNAKNVTDQFEKANKQTMLHVCCQLVIVAH